MHFADLFIIKRKLTFFFNSLNTHSLKTKLFIFSPDIIDLSSLFLLLLSDQRERERLSPARETEEEEEEEAERGEKIYFVVFVAPTTRSRSSRERKID